MNKTKSEAQGVKLTITDYAMSPSGSGTLPTLPGAISPTYKQIIQEKIEKRLQKATELQENGDIPAAIIEYKKLLFLDGNNVEFHRKIADLYAQNNDIKKALVHLRKSQHLSYDHRIKQ
jgi:hypothetical protein